MSVYGCSYVSRKWQSRTSTTVAGHADAGQQGPGGSLITAPFAVVLPFSKAFDFLTFLPPPPTGWDSQYVLPQLVITLRYT